MFDFEVEKRISAMESSKFDSVEELKIFSEALNYYFSNGRPREMHKYRDRLTIQFARALELMNFDDTINFGHHFFLFWRTVSPEDENDDGQSEVENLILHPIKRRLNQMSSNSGFLLSKNLKYKPNPNHILIITRHASSQSSYAPGKQIYEFSRSLTKKGIIVWVLSEGEIDENYTKLMAENPNFLVFQYRTKGLSERFKELRARCEVFKPKQIITDAEVALISALHIFGVSSNVILSSQGFYKVPWYDSILMSQEIYDKDKFRKINRYVESYQTLSLDLLAPEKPKQIIDQAKESMGIKPNDFVIGSFARYEQFSYEFLDLMSKILEQNKSVKCILAGPNSREPAKERLNKYIRQGRIFLLGPSDAHILGHCCDAGIDSFPAVQGFSCVELMAKGKPVFVLDCPNLARQRKNRLPEMIFDSKNSLLAGIKQSLSSKKFYKKMSEKSVKLGASFDRGDEVADIILSISK